MVTQFLSVVCAALVKIPTVTAALSYCSSKSSHEATIINTRPFSILQDKNMLNKVYSFPRPRYWSDSMECHSESDVSTLVKVFLSYVLTALGLSNELVIASEVSVFQSRPDLWLLRKVFSSGHSIPIGVLEVKKPGTNLDNQQMHGQLFDYLLMLKSSFNLNIALGILTNFNEWQVLWLPDGDVEQAVTTFEQRPTSPTPLATSQPSQECDDIPTHDISVGQNAADGYVTEGLESECSNVCSNESEKVLPRVCSGTCIVRNTDPVDVLSLIVTTIHKMLQTMVLTTAQISSSKVYFQLTEKSWHWVTCPWKDADTLKYDEMPSTNTKKFYLLKPLGRGIQSSVWLACTKSLKVCAVKFYHAKHIAVKDVAMKEETMWKTLGFTKSHFATLQNRDCLIMPYMKPCSQIILHGFYDMAKTAIEELSKKQLYHNDIKIENMGYYFDKNKKVCIGLLDVGSIVQSDEEKVTTMLRQLQVIMETISKYPSTPSTPARALLHTRHS